MAEVSDPADSRRGLRYAGAVRYPEGGGLDAEERARRERVRLADRPRQRAVEAGPRHRLVFVDRGLTTLVHLRHGVTHDVFAC
jgi:hypothetical protein